jgi:hypothetical protein
MPEAQRISAVGIPWYRRDQWDQCVAIMADREKLPRTYSEWLHRAQQVVETVKRQGQVPVRAYIDPATFPEWCRAHSLHIDAQARTDYAAPVARQHHTTGNG